MFVVAFAVFAFADGVLDFVLAGSLRRAGQRWGWYVFGGLVSIAAGVVALAHPGATLLALVLVVGIVPSSWVSSSLPPPSPGLSSTRAG